MEYTAKNNPQKPARPNTVSIPSSSTHTVNDLNCEKDKILSGIKSKDVVPGWQGYANRQTNYFMSLGLSFPAHHIVSWSECV